MCGWWWSYSVMMMSIYDLLYYAQGKDVIYFVEQNVLLWFYEPNAAPAAM